MLVGVFLNGTSTSILYVQISFLAQAQYVLNVRKFRYLKIWVGDPLKNWILITFFGIIKSVVLHLFDFAFISLPSLTQTEV